MEEFHFKRRFERRKSALNSVPYNLRGHVFVVVAIDVSGASHLPPCDARVTRL